jgi:hypothetical protein
MAAHANRFDPKRESILPESFTRKPYDRQRQTIDYLSDVRGNLVGLIQRAEDEGARGHRLNDHG